MEVDPRTRNAFVALVKEFIPRVMRVMWSSRTTIDSCKQALSRENAKRSLGFGLEQQDKLKSIIEVNETTHNQHSYFFQFYMHFLAYELRATASYQRHIIALHVLSTVLRCACSKNTVGFLEADLIDREVEWLGQGSFTRSLLRPLFDLLMDPFDDVRGMAASVLLMILENIWEPRFYSLKGEAVQVPLAVATGGDKGDNCLDLSNMLNRVQSTLRTTGRADHADGAARLYCAIWRFGMKSPDWHVNRTLAMENLFSDLEGAINAAVPDLRLALGNRPLHGHLITLRSCQTSCGTVTQCALIFCADI